MTPAVPTSLHFTVAIYVVGASVHRVEVNRIEARSADQALEVAFSTLRAVARSLESPSSLRGEIVDVQPIFDAPIKG